MQVGIGDPDRADRGRERLAGGGGVGLGRRGSLRVHVLLLRSADGPGSDPAILDNVPIPSSRRTLAASHQTSKSRSAAARAPSPASAPCAASAAGSTPIRVQALGVRARPLVRQLGGRLGVELKPERAAEAETRPCPPASARSPRPPVAAPAGRSGNEATAPEARARGRWSRSASSRPRAAPRELTEPPAATASAWPPKQSPSTGTPRSRPRRRKSISASTHGGAESVERRLLGAEGRDPAILAGVVGQRIAPGAVDLVLERARARPLAEDRRRAVVAVLEDQPPSSLYRHRFEPSGADRGGGYRPADVRGRPSSRAVPEPARGRRFPALPARRARRRGGAAPRRADDRPPQRTGPEEAATRPNIVVVMTDDQTLEQMRALPQVRRLIGTQRSEVQALLRHGPALLPVAGDLLHRPVRAQHGRDLEQRRERRRRAARVRRRSRSGCSRPATGRAFVGKYLNGYGIDDPERVPPGWSEWKALIEPTTAGLLRLRPERRRADGPLRHRARGLQDPGPRPPRGRRRPPCGARQSPAVPLPGLQRPARAEHAGAGRRGLARGFPGAAHAGVRRARPVRQAALPPRSPAAERERDRPHRRPQPARARVAGRGRPPGRAAWSRRCARRASSGRPIILFTSDNGYLDGEHRIEFGKLLPYEPASRGAAAAPRAGDPGGRDLRRARRQRRPGADDRPDRRGEADDRGRRPLAALAGAQPDPVDRSRAADRVAGPRPVDRLRLSVRGDSQRPLPLRRLRDRRRGALQPRPRPVRAASRSPANRATPPSSGRWRLR